MSINSIVSRKIDKSKINVDSYLSGGSSQRREASQIPSGMIRGSSHVPSSQANVSGSMMKAKSSKNEVEGKAIGVLGERIDSSIGVLVRFNKQENRIEFNYEREKIKHKIEAKRDQIIPKRVKIDLVQETITFQFKMFLLRKQDDKDAPKPHHNQDVTVYMKDQDQIRNFMESSFSEGLIEANPSLQPRTATPNGDNAQNVPEVEEGDEDHSNARFQMPTSQQLAETEKLRRTIKDMKEQDKMTVLFEVFKIKKEFDDPSNINHKLKCPVSSCGKTYREVGQLKNHLKSKHPELSKHGIELTEYDGSFEYSAKALDLALYLGKMFPHEMKKIIKTMKTKPTQ